MNELQVLRNQQQMWQNQARQQEQAWHRPCVPEGRRCAVKLVHPIDVNTYRSHPAINISSLKAFSRSALHAMVGFEEEKEPTEAMAVGSLLDHKVLGTPYLWTTSPYDDYRTKEARAWRDEQTERGVTVFKQDAIETVERMVQAVRQHPVAGRIFAEPGKAQVGMFG